MQVWEFWLEDFILQGICLVSDSDVVSEWGDSPELLRDVNQSPVWLTPIPLEYWPGSGVQARTLHSVLSPHRLLSEDGRGGERVWSWSSDSFTWGPCNAFPFILSTSFEQDVFIYLSSLSFWRWTRCRGGLGPAVSHYNETSSSAKHTLLLSCEKPSLSDVTHWTTWSETHWTRCIAEIWPTTGSKTNWKQWNYLEVLNLLSGVWSVSADTL